MNRKLTATLGVLAAACLAASGSVALAATAQTGQTGEVAPHAGSVLAVSSVRASTDDGNVASNTLDGNLSTRWSGEGDGAWIDYDLGSSQTVGSVALAWYQGDTRTFTFDVQVSANDSSWTTVVSGKKSSGSSANYETYDFADAAARYVRVVGHGNTKNDWTSISETHVQGADGGGGDPGGDCSKPSDILNLDNWYLGLPIGSDEDPTNIEQPELDSYSIDPWFEVTSDCTGVQFRAAVNGVTTSGSSYPRSELREIDGGDNASWSSTSGTHTMVIKEKITHLPNTRTRWSRVRSTARTTTSWCSGWKAAASTSPTATTPTTSW